MRILTLLMIACFAFPAGAVDEHCNGSPNCGGDELIRRFTIIDASSPAGACSLGDHATALATCTGSVTSSTFVRLPADKDWCPVSFAAVATANFNTAAKTCTMTAVWAAPTVANDIDTNSFTGTIETGPSNDLEFRGDPGVVDMIGQTCLAGGSSLSVKISGGTCTDFAGANATITLRGTPNSN